MFSIGWSWCGCAGFGVAATGLRGKPDDCFSDSDGVLPCCPLELNLLYTRSLSVSIWLLTDSVTAPLLILTWFVAATKPLEPPTPMDDFIFFTPFSIDERCRYFCTPGIGDCI